jgi:hypothetical protein
LERAVEQKLDQFVQPIAEGGLPGVHRSNLGDAE